MKKILIIDGLSSCDGCPCHDGMDGRCECTVTLKDLEDTHTIDKDCPLKPLPKKEESTLIFNGERIESAYVKGWNDCLSEIIGDEE